MLTNVDMFSGGYWPKCGSDDCGTDSWQSQDCWPNYSEPDRNVRWFAAREQGQQRQKAQICKYPVSIGLIELKPFCYLDANTSFHISSFVSDMSYWTIDSMRMSISLFVRKSMTIEQFFRMPSWHIFLWHTLYLHLKKVSHKSYFCCKKSESYGYIWDVYLWLSISPQITMNIQYYTSCLPSSTIICIFCICV